ncbi:sugar-transfer associated ATP-grasp domain-containing protein [uncultured Winogradskyella sp.]|uniref:sugar-transfer associated ATP-grasp domain-containing protein n=1 Tax=uncultured Winogradskyella sp. TaxID=395353 RepID=UPI00260FD9DF|nr:sugar-transfer associated ATP-grasp domain-containing protein [uncultured Winogradskyella sp.]
MNLYSSLKRILIKHVLGYRKRFWEFNLKMNARKYVKEIIRQNKSPELSTTEVNQAKAFYKSKGYKLDNTYWHKYYKGLTNAFFVNYIPEDIFNAIIAPSFNQMRQWPALLDKNLSYNLFQEFVQPTAVVQNINGFYFVDGKIVNESAALEKCNTINSPLIIKPTIDSGDGVMVHKFNVTNYKTTYENLTTLDLFKKYKKDFIVQEAVEQSDVLKSLNPSSLNTVRVMTYLKTDGVHVLSSVLRIGQPNSSTDNFCGGGIICGIKPNGSLKSKAYTRDGAILNKSHTKVTFEGITIPNYNALIDMVKTMHPIIPYFKIVSWDIGMNKENQPVFIEFNTYYQDVDLHQITNGPLFGEFTDEILAISLNPTETAYNGL